MMFSSGPASNSPLLHRYRRSSPTAKKGGGVSMTFLVLWGLLTFSLGILLGSMGALQRFQSDAQEDPTSSTGGVVVKIKRPYQDLVSQHTPQAPPPPQQQQQQDHESPSALTKPEYVPPKKHILPGAHEWKDPLGLLEDMPRFPWRQNVPLKRNWGGCKLAIIAAGSPRSGSTWQELMTMAILHALGVGKDEHKVGKDFWKEYYKMDEGADKEEQIKLYRDSIGRLRPDQVVLYKSHLFDPELLTLCQDAVVFTTYRDLRDVLASMTRFSRLTWVRVQSHEVWEGLLRQSVFHHAKWAQHSAVNAKYEVVKHNPTAYAMVIAQQMALAMKHEITDEEMSKILNLPILTKRSGHKDQAATSNTTLDMDTLSREQRLAQYPWDDPEGIVQQLEDTFREWLVSHDYPMLFS